MKLQKAADLDTQYHVQYICPLNSVQYIQKLLYQVWVPSSTSTYNLFLMTQVIDELTGNKENTMCYIVRKLHYKFCSSLVSKVFKLASM